MMLKFCIGMLMAFKGKMKIAIQMNVIVGALFFGFYLMIR